MVLRYRKIGILAKLENPYSLSMLQEVASFLIKEGYQIHLEPASKRKVALSNHQRLKFIDIENSCDRLDLLLTIGGDGTLLRGARYLLNGTAWKTCKLAGINTGRVGFLAVLGPRFEISALHSLLKAKPSSFSKRNCLQISIYRKEIPYKHFQALNDGVLTKGHISRLFEVEVATKGKVISSYRADGLILSTPTGSTAYNLAAGGAILEPEINAFQIAPICPQAFSSKPIVLSLKNSIDLRVKNPTTDVFLTIDGHTAELIREGDQIRVQSSPKSIALYTGTSYSYLLSLRHKLKWGLV